MRSVANQPPAMSPPQPFFLVTSERRASLTLELGEGLRLRIVEPTEEGFRQIERALREDGSRRGAVVALEGLHPEFERLHGEIRRRIPETELLVIYPRLSAMKHILNLPSEPGESPKIRIREYGLKTSVS